MQKLADLMPAEICIIKAEGGSPSAFYYAGKTALKYNFICLTAALQSGNIQATK